MTVQNDSSAAAPPDAQSLFRSQTLLDAIEPAAHSDANASLACALAALHNAGEIDALSLATWPALADLSTPRAHFVERFLGLLLPELTATTPAMLNFAATLIAPDRKSYHAFLDGLLDWLRRNPQQAQAIVQLAVALDARALPLLSLALQAVADLPAARAIIAAHEDERRLRALHALGWIPHADAVFRDASVLALSALPAEADDPTRAQILEALANLFRQADTELTPDAVTLVGRLLAAGGEATRYQAARALLNASVFGDDAVTALLDGLIDLDPDQPGTVESLDLALADMMRADHAAIALSFLARIVPAGRVPLSRFEIVLGDLLTGPHARLAGTTVDWLLSGQSGLARGVAKAIQGVGGSPIILHPDLIPRNFSGPRLVSLCRKAVGFFDLQPVTAASLVVAALRAAPRDAIGEIETLLFETLLVHYSGALETYLSGLPRSDAAYRPVRRALKRKATYVAGFQATGRIAELRPSEQRRQVEYERHAEQMRRSFAEARNASQLLSLFPSSTLLYGRQSMTFLTDPGGQRRSTEVMLQSHGASFEVPRGLKLDPMGLEEMTVIFRAEGVAA